MVLTSSDPSPCHITSTNHSSKFNVGLSKAESVTMASHLPKSDPDCSQAQNIAHGQPQDKPKARGHKVPILNRIFSVSCGSQAECTGVPNLFKAESAKNHGASRNMEIR